MAVCWTAVLGRQALRVRDLRHQPWPDHDPSRGAVEHGSGDFVRHAWRGHAGWPDSVAEPPSAGHGAFLSRRLRRSRSGPDRTADKQELGSGSARTGTSCKTLHRGTRDRMRFVAKAHTRSSPARFGGSSVAGSCSLARSCWRPVAPSTSNLPHAPWPVDMWTTQGRCPHAHRLSNSKPKSDSMIRDQQESPALLVTPITHAPPTCATVTSPLRHLCALSGSHRQAAFSQERKR